MKNSEIENSEIYKRITKKDFIYQAIYSLESYTFEKDLLEEDDYILMLKLRDPFNHEVIDETIKKVRSLIEAVLIGDNFFETQVYFRPKKIDENNGKLVSRPIHSASLYTLIASVVLLNALLIENGKDNKSVELTELARMLPSNFYGNIPSERPEHLFKPWQHQYKKYSDAITSAYYEYTKTKEYKFEITLDLKDYFPSINPAIIYDEILSKCSVKYDSSDDIQCIEKIVSKLLLFKISNLNNDNFKEQYYDPYDEDVFNGEVWTKGIPQGLPHAYFFGNICMIRVADIFQKIVAGEDGKAFYYVDDSVIYTNNLIDEDELKVKIEEVNKELESWCSRYSKGTSKASMKAFTNMLPKFKYLIEVHNVNSEKSTMLKIQNTKYGQANLNAYSKLASMTSYDLSKIFSDSEEINLLNKLKAVYDAVEKEIDRIKNHNSSENSAGNEIHSVNNFASNIDTSNYMKVLLRLKKFFKYREKMMEYNRSNNIPQNDINQLLSKFKLKDIENNKEKFKHFFDAYDEDILLNEFRFFFANVPSFWDQTKKIIDDFNKETYTKSYKWNQKGKDDKCSKECTVSYIHKISMNLSRRKKIQIETDISNYDSISNIMKSNLWNIYKLGKQAKEKEIQEATNIFFNIFIDNSRDTSNTKNHLKDQKDGLNRIESPLYNIIKQSGLNDKFDNRYNLINLQTDELYRVLMNAYYSEVISIDADDLKYLAKKNNKPIYYNEARILLFLRNREFKLENFYSKFKNFKNSEVLDYTLFEVVDYFEKFVRDPVYVDNLIMIHKYTSDIWKNGSKYLHFYTLHNQEHAVELIKSIVIFMKSVNYFQISRRDYYILFISCYLHDVSMVLHPNLMESFIKDNRESNLIYSEFKSQLRNLLETNEQGDIEVSNINYIKEEPTKKILVNLFKRLDQYYESYVRDNHSKQSARFIRNSNDIDFVEDVVKEIVAEVSQSHGYSINEIYKIKSNAKESILSEKYIKILLRIGDLLDMSSSRISNAILDNSQKSMSKTTRFHWLSHKAISNVDIQVNYTNIASEAKSWIGPGSIIEEVDFIIYLDVKHIIGLKSWEDFNSNFSGKGTLNTSETSHFYADLSKDGNENSSDFDFMQKWMKVKNEYLYKELIALQSYLNRLEANLFQTNINVKYEYNEGAKKLSSSEFENILKYISDN